MSELWYFFTLSECFPCRHSTFCCCNLSRQCCETVATFYVPTEMSPCFASGASKMMSVDSHKCFQTDNVLVTQTLFCRFSRSHWMSAKCQQLGVSNHFRLIKKVKEKRGILSLPGWPSKWAAHSSCDQTLHNALHNTIQYYTYILDGKSSHYVFINSLIHSYNYQLSSSAELHVNGITGIRLPVYWAFVVIKLNCMLILGGSALNEEVTSRAEKWTQSSAGYCRSSIGHLRLAKTKSFPSGCEKRPTKQH